MILVNREMGAVVRTMSRPDGNSSPLRLEPGAPISRSARTGLLPDFPVGGLRTELVATHNRSAATVTQAGGLNGLPAFSSFVQRQAGEPGVTQRHSGLKRLPASVGGATWGTW